MSVSISWNPSARRPRTLKKGLSLAGAGSRTTASATECLHQPGKVLETELLSSNPPVQARALKGRCGSLPSVAQAHQRVGHGLPALRESRVDQPEQGFLGHSHGWRTALESDE